jgi:polymorphic toxin system nucleotidyltransferase-like protein
VPTSTHDQFSRALEALIVKIKEDRSILATVLCGSLSHDTVWDKSDIDLVLVTIDEKKLSEEGLALYADGINVHALLMSRTDFRKLVEGSLRSSFFHSFLAKGRLLYTHESGIAALCERLHSMGERDIRIQLLNAAGSTLPAVYKAHKWFRTRGDLNYAALWILHAANGLARIEVLGARQLADREVLPHAAKLNPAFFKLVYTDLLNNKKTTERVQEALTAIDNYLADRTSELFGLVIDYLQEIGEARSATEIDDHFRRNFGVGGVTGVCEYLSDRGLLGKAPLPVRLTRKSNINVDELAFFYRNPVTEEAPSDW